MRRRFLAVGAAIVCVAGSAAPVAAVEPIPGTPIPDEGLLTTLADAATDVLAFDLDHDGVRELLVSGDIDGSPGFAAIEAWWIEADGSTERSDQVPVRRALSVDELYLGPATLEPDEQGMIPTRIGEPATFVIARRDGRDVVLVATTGTSQSLGIVPCCLTIWEVSTAGPSQIDLALVADTQASGTHLAVLDLDGDGTDELVVNEATQSDTGGSIDLVLLRWDGTRFQPERVPVPTGGGCCTALLAAGELDGAPGEELVMVAPDGEAAATTLGRLSLQSGRATFERGTVTNALSARVVTLFDGPALVTGDGATGLALWAWPRGEPLRSLATRNNGGSVLDVFGTGPETLLLVGDPMEPDHVVAIPADLRDVDPSGVGPSIISLERDTRVGALNGLASESPLGLRYPSLAWPVPGGVSSADGPQEAFVFSGGLVRASIPPSPPVVAPVALLPGQVLLGAAGPDLGWMSIWASPEHGIQQFPRPRPAPHEDVIDLLARWPPGGLVLVATDAVLAPEVNQSQLEPTFSGVAADPDQPGSLLVGNEAVDALVEGPPGTRVWWTTRGASGQSTIGPDGRVSIRLLEPAGPDAPDGSGAQPAMWALTPAGHAYHGTWSIRVFRQPPDLGLEDTVPIIDFEPTLSGRTLPGSTVSVDGVEVRVQSDGSFATPIEVGILPTELRIVATDPIGNQTIEVVTRVWPFDYRQLPFVPLVVLVTAGVGIFLYLRRPEAGARRTDPDDEASFEEIGG